METKKNQFFIHCENAKNYLFLKNKQQKTNTTYYENCFEQIFLCNFQHQIKIITILEFHQNKSMQKKTKNNNNKQLININIYFLFVIYNIY